MSSWSTHEPLLIRPVFLAEFGLSNTAVSRDAVGEPHIAADDGIAANRDAAQDGRSGINNHIVFNDWMPCFALDERAVFVCRKAPRSKSYRLIDTNTLPDDRSLANDNAGSMIDKEIRANLSTWMNIDPGLRVCNAGNKTRDERRSAEIKGVRKALIDDCSHPRIAEHYFVKIPGRRVATKCSLDVADKQAADRRQLICKTVDDFGSVLTHFRVVAGVAGEQQTAVNLLYQRDKRAVERRAHKVVDIFAPELRLSIMGRKQRRRKVLENVGQDVARRRLLKAAPRPDVVTDFPGKAKLRYDRVEILVRHERIGRALGLIIRRRWMTFGVFHQCPSRLRRIITARNSIFC